jgi:hypothetical protein
MDVIQQFLLVVFGVMFGLLVVVALLKGGNDDDFGGMA